MGFCRAGRGGTQNQVGDKGEALQVFPDTWDPSKGAWSGLRCPRHPSISEWWVGTVWGPGPAGPRPRSLDLPVS